MGELKNLVEAQKDVLTKAQDLGRDVLHAGLGLIDVLKAEGEKLQALDFKAEVEKLQAIDLKAQAESLKARLSQVDVKADGQKLLADLQKFYQELVVKGQQRAA